MQCLVFFSEFNYMRSDGPHVYGRLLLVFRTVLVFLLALLLGDLSNQLPWPVPFLGGGSQHLQLQLELLEGLFHVMLLQSNHKGRFCLDFETEFNICRLKVRFRNSGFDAANHEKIVTGKIFDDDFPEENTFKGLY
jgi:hypothetical protein